MLRLIGSYCLVFFNLVTNLNKAGLCASYSILSDYVMLYTSNIVLLSYRHASVVCLKTTVEFYRELEGTELHP